MHSHQAADTCSNIQAQHLSAAHDAENLETATATGFAGCSWWSSSVFAVIKRLSSSVWILSELYGLILACDPLHRSA